MAVYVNSLSEYVDFLEAECQEEDILFRGQRCVDKVLLPKIARSRHKNILETEREMLAEFKRGAIPYLQIIPENDWEWLVVAQHHGLHTRLIDWSYDPYVALWFALEKSKKNGSRPEVWVMNPLKEDVIDDLKNTRPFSGQRTKVFNSLFNIPRLNAQKGCFVLFKHIKKQI